MYNNLERLFYQGQQEQYIAEDEKYLLFHPEDEDVLFLMVAAYPKEAHDILDYVYSFSGYDPVADEYKKFMKKTGCFSNSDFN